MASKILVVDDSPYIRREIRRSLEQRTDGIVYEVEHGKIALVMVGTHKPHLVILRSRRSPLHSMKLRNDTLRAW
jgi:PleD family two-component response regulator